MRGTRTASLSTSTGFGAIDALLMIFAKDSYLDMLAAAGGADQSDEHPTSLGRTAATVVRGLECAGP
jgi:hypothetical protein